MTKKYGIKLRWEDNAYTWYCMLGEYSSDAYLNPKPVPFDTIEEAEEYAQAVEFPSNRYIIEEIPHEV